MLAVAATQTPGWAQVATYDTTADSAATSITASKSATTVASGVTASTITRTTLTAGTTGVAGTFTSTTPSIATGIAIGTNYFGFTLTPTTGNLIFATAINWTSQGTTTSPNIYATAYSTDAFATSNSTPFTGTTVTTPVARNYNITDLITNDALAVRMYNYGTTSISGGTSSATSLFSIITPTVLGSSIATAASTITLAANTEIRTGTTLSLAGNITGGFSVTKAGTGTLTLSGTNSQTGGTAVSAGTLIFSSTAAIAGSGANLTVNAGGTAVAGYGIDQAFLGRVVNTSAGSVAINTATSTNLDFTGKTALSLGAIGSVAYTGTLTPDGTTFRLGGGGGTLTFNQVISGASSLVVGGQTSGGTVILAGTGNSIGGTTSVTAGTLSLPNSTTMVGNVTVGASGTTSAATTGAITIGTGATLTTQGTLNLVGFASTYLTSITGAGKLQLGNTASTASAPDIQFNTVSGTPFGNIISTQVDFGGGSRFIAGNPARNDVGRYSGDVRFNNSLIGSATLNLVGGPQNSSHNFHVVFNADNSATFTGSVVLNGSDLALTNANALTGINSISFVNTVAGSRATLFLFGRNLTVGSIDDTGNLAGTSINIRNGSLNATGGGTNTLAVASSTTLGVNADSVLTINQTTAGNFGGVISDGLNDTGTGVTTGTYRSLGITKDGAATLSLGGNNTYSGITTVKTGTLLLNGLNSGTAPMIVNSGGTLAIGSAGDYSSTVTTINSGGVLDVSAVTSGYNLALGRTLVVGRTGVVAADVIGTLNIAGNLNIGAIGSFRTATINGALTLNSANLALDLGSTPTPGSGVNDLIAVIGNLTLSGTTNLSLSLPTAGLTTGSYTLMTYTGSLTGDATNLVVPNIPSGSTRQSIAIDTASTAGSVLLNVTGSSANLTFVGAVGNNVWDVKTTADWTGDTNPTPDNRFFDLDNVTFDATGVGGAANPVVINSTVTPGSISVVGAQNYTFTGTGAIAGTATLNKSGAGILTLATANTYTGGTNLAGGTIIAANASGSATSTGIVSISSGATLQIGDGTTNGSVASDITNNGSVVFNRSDAINQLSGIISGTGTVTQAGSSTLTLGTTNTYTGGTIITAGTLPLTSDAQLSTVPASATPKNLVIVGGTLSIPASLSLSANRGVAVGPATGSGGGTIDVASTFTLTIPGIIANNGGTGSITKTSAGTLALSGVNTFSGGINLNGGVLSITNGSAMGSGTLTVGTGALSAAASTHTGFLVINNTAAVNVPNNIVLPAPTVAATPYDFVKTAASSSTGTQVSFDGIISGGNSNLFFSLDTNTTSDNTTVFRFSNTNTFVGTVQLFRGALLVTNPNSFGASTNPIQLNGNFNGTLGDLRFENSITFANPIALTVNSAISTAANTVTLSSVISGAGQLFKVGSGTLNVGSANTYTGVSNIQQGTLSTSSIVVAAGSSGLGNATSVVVLGDTTNTGTLNYTGNAATYTRGFTIAAGGGRVLVATAAQTLTIGTANIAAGGPLTLGGTGNVAVTSAITGAGALTKTGTGSLNLTGTNTFSGGTTVTAGVLLANNATNSLGAGVVNVSAGVLAGGGKVANTSGRVIITTGGTISPGATGDGTSITTTLTTGNQTWVGGTSNATRGTYAIDINSLDASIGTKGTDWDYLELGTSNLLLTTTSNGGAGPFRLLINAMAGPVSTTTPFLVAHAGTLNSLPDAASAVSYINTHPEDFLASDLAGGSDWIVSAAVNGTAGFDLFVAVPEPGTIGLVASAAVGLLLRRRRKSANMSTK